MLWRRRVARVVVRTIHLDSIDQRQLDRVLTLVREVLGSTAKSAYLFGSAVQGGLKAESDLDVFVVTTRRTSHAEKMGLVDRLLPISGIKTPGRRGRRVELTVVVQGEVRPWRYPPRMDFQYGDWWREDFESGNLEPWSSELNPDLAILITMVRLWGETLFGPPPAEVFDAIPQEDLFVAMADGLDGLRAELDGDTRNVVLTLARIWSTFATGVISSKDAAADWVLDRLPAEHRPVLAHARAVYLGLEAENWAELKVGLDPHADHVVAQIARLGRRVPRTLGR